MIVKPMSSITGYLTYINYVAGTNKGGIAQGEEFNGTWHLGKMTEERQNYTSERVVEALEFDGTGADAQALMWQPVDITTDAAGMHTNIVVKDATGTVLVEGTDYLVDDTDAKNVKVTGLAAATIKVGYVYKHFIVHLLA